jgi:hypothetical protein
LCNGIKLGTESMGGFENVVIGNCSIEPAQLSGIAIETVDGGTLDGVTISNIVMRSVGNPLFIRLGARGRPVQPGGPRLPPGRLRNVTISNLDATATELTGSSITGLAGHEVENVTLDNVRMVFPGGGKRELAQRAVAELPEAYPEYGMFGDLPAYGLFCRHVKNLLPRNVEMRVEGSGGRPALWCDDIQELLLAGASSSGLTDARAAVVFHDVRDALVYGCRSPRFSGVWLEISGARSGGIALRANDLSRAGRTVQVGRSGGEFRTLDGGDQFIGSTAGEWLK